MEAVFKIQINNPSINGFFSFYTKYNWLDIFAKYVWFIMKVMRIFWEKAYFWILSVQILKILS